MAGARPQVGEARSRGYCQPWQTQPGPGVCLQDLGVPELVSDFSRGRSAPDTAGWGSGTSRWHTHTMHQP